MDTVFNRTSFPDLYGLRIHHINNDYGGGTIMRAYPVCKDGSDDISIDIRFDNGRPTTSFSLLKCIKKGLLVMDSADYTTEKLENMLRSIRSSEETNATPQSCSFPIDNQIQSDMNDFFFEFDFEYNEKERKRAEKREARKAGPRRIFQCNRRALRRPFPLRSGGSPTPCPRPSGWEARALRFLPSACRRALRYGS